MKNKHGFLQGFTLIELLVVISIIAVLMSVMMPALQKARMMSRRTICANYCKQWALSLHSYTAENDGKFPRRVEPDALPSKYILTNPYQYAKRDGSGTYFDHVESFIKPYVGGHQYVLCPDMKWENYRDYDWDQQWSMWGVKGGDYSFFITYTQKMIDMFPNHLAAKNFHPGRASNIAPGTPVVGDHVRFFTQASGYSGWMYAHPWQFQAREGTPPKGMNAAMIDGSAEWITSDYMERFIAFSGGQGETMYWPKISKIASEFSR